MLMRLFISSSCPVIRSCGSKRNSLLQGSGACFNGVFGAEEPIESNSDVRACTASSNPGFVYVNLMLINTLCFLSFWDHDCLAQTHACSRTHARTHTHTHARMQRTHARTHARTHTHTHTDIHVRTHARTRRAVHTNPFDVDSQVLQGIIVDGSGGGSSHTCSPLGCLKTTRVTIRTVSVSSLQKSEMEGQSGVCVNVRQSCTFQNCGCTSLDMSDLKENTKQIDGREKQPSQGAVSREIWNVEELETLSGGTVPRTSYHLCTRKA